MPMPAPEMMTLPMNMAVLRAGPLSVPIQTLKAQQLPMLENMQAPTPFQIQTLQFPSMSAMPVQVQQPMQVLPPVPVPMQVSSLQPTISLAIDNANVNVGATTNVGATVNAVNILNTGAKANAGITTKVNIGSTGAPASAGATTSVKVGATGNAGASTSATTSATDNVGATTNADAGAIANVGAAASSDAGDTTSTTNPGATTNVGATVSPVNVLNTGAKGNAGITKVNKRSIGAPASAGSTTSVKVGATGNAGASTSATTGATDNLGATTSADAGAIANVGAAASSDAGIVDARRYAGTTTTANSNTNANISASIAAVPKPISEIQRQDYRDQSDNALPLEEEILDEQEVNYPTISYGQSVNQPPQNQPNTLIRSPVRLFHILGLIHFGSIFLFRAMYNVDSSPNTKLTIKILRKTLFRLENGLWAVTVITQSERMLDFSCNTLNRWVFKLLQWQYWPNEINRLAVYFEEN